MVLSIGIDYNKGTWKTCLMENSHALELRFFNDVPNALAYLQHTCALYPDPIITVASDISTLSTSPGSLNEHQPHAISDHQKQYPTNDNNEFLTTIGSINFNSYSIPAVRHLPGIPVYRRRNRWDMGTSNKLCAVTSLLYHMRVQEAIWQEMCFLYLDVDRDSRSIIVVEDGCIVNGLGETSGTYPYAARKPEQFDSAEPSASMENEAIAEQAFWEGLTQDLAGLMAIHHLEDIVVNGFRKDELIKRMGDRYQLYNFPYAEPEYEGFEAAMGAAIIAGGLYHPGLAAEVVERLQLSQMNHRFSLYSRLN